MIGNIVNQAGGGSSSGLDGVLTFLGLNSYYEFIHDYLNNITLSEEQFFMLLDLEPLDSRWIGQININIPNQYSYHVNQTIDSIYTIADINHCPDQPGTVDLIPKNCTVYYPMAFRDTTLTSDPVPNYRYSDIRTWLNNTFYNGYSNLIKQRMIKIKYYYDSTKVPSGSSGEVNEAAWYDDDYIVIPSHTEAGGTPGDVSGGFAQSQSVEGIAYPNFNRSRNSGWWTRSFAGGGRYNVVFIKGTSFQTDNFSWNASYGVLPIIRIRM